MKPGDIVTCDNLPAHKVAQIKESIKAPRASILYLPPYSPGLNPIEQVFAKLKALLRRAAVLSYEMLWRTIGELLTQISLDECQNFFENSGYIHLIEKCSSLNC